MVASRLPVWVLLAAAACTHTTIDVQGLDCDNGNCLDGFICNPTNNKCAVITEVGCGVPGRVCPSMVNTGDQCPGPNAFIPCDDLGPADCSQGCRICQADNTWGDCEGCTVGDVTSCADCGDDCTMLTNVDTAACNTSGMVNVCEITTCVPGFTDSDMNPATGCEAMCIQTNGGVETCDGLDNDCDGSTDDVPLMIVTSECEGRNCTGCEVASWSCDMGNCIPSCTTDNYDANGMASDGCEYFCSPTTAGPEICDGEDNDCNGDTDTADAALDVQADCAAQECTACGVSAWQCTMGACQTMTCAMNQVDTDTAASNGCECPITNGGVETCDDLDNDCDGFTDSADSDLDMAPEVNMDCSAQECAMCDVQQWRCTSGACTINMCAMNRADENMTTGDGCECTIVGERCDNMDEDCDGVADNGVLNCQCNPLCASPPCTPAVDDMSCDGIDSDCDDAVDEDCPCMETFLLDVTPDFVCSGNKGGGLERSGRTLIVAMELLATSNCGNSLTNLTIDLHPASNTQDADILSAALWADTAAPIGEPNIGDLVLQAGVNMTGRQLVFDTLAPHTIPMASSIELYVVVSGTGMSQSYFAGQVATSTSFTLANSSGMQSLASTPLIEGSHSIQPNVTPSGRLCTSNNGACTNSGDCAAGEACMCPGGAYPDCAPGMSGQCTSGPEDLGLGSHGADSVRRWQGNNDSGDWRGTCSGSGICAGTAYDGAGDELGWTAAATIETTSMYDCDHRAPNNYTTLVRDEDDQSRYLHIDSGIPLGLPMCSGLEMRFYAGTERDNGTTCDADLLEDYARIALLYYEGTTTPAACSMEDHPLDCSNNENCKGPDTAGCGGSASEYFDLDLTTLYDAASLDANAVTNLGDLHIRFLPQSSTNAEVCDALDSNGPGTINAITEMYFLLMP